MYLLFYLKKLYISHSCGLLLFIHLSNLNGYKNYTPVLTPIKLSKAVSN